MPPPFLPAPSGIRAPPPPPHSASPPLPATLTGRGSLVRLIGRRRCSPLPASSRPPSLSPSTPYQADDGGAGEGGGRWFSGGSDGVGAEWVACPVCGESIRGRDYCVNAHLDICITRGAKRKLTQSTLLDFRFSKITTAEPALDSLNNDDEAENMEPIDRDVPSVRAFFLTNSDTGNSKGTATPLLPGCLHGSLDISKTCNTSIPLNTVLPNVKNAATDDAVEKGSSCMLPTGTTSGSIDACAGSDSSTTVAVGTVIVGRRFHENIELQEGLGVTVLRDPQNAKDPDAIKMLYAGSECAQMLGYLPRELAKVLAPQPGKHYVECKGFMVSLPEQQLDNVPIQLTYQKCKKDNQRYNDLKYRLSLWENFVGAVRNGNLQRPSSARYKTDFNSMIADVMANHTHLCSDKEPSF